MEDNGCNLTHKAQNYNGCNIDTQIKYCAIFQKHYNLHSFSLFHNFNIHHCLRRHQVLVLANLSGAWETTKFITVVTLTHVTTVTPLIQTLKKLTMSTILVILIYYFTTDIL